jgi:hypothetical protein
MASRSDKSVQAPAQPNLTLTHAPHAGRLQVGRRVAWPCPKSPGPSPTCCCWTSRPTTWTWTQWRRWCRCAGPGNKLVFFALQVGDTWLLLDAPSSHLDLDAVEALVQASRPFQVWGLHAREVMKRPQQVLGGPAPLLLLRNSQQWRLSAGRPADRWPPGAPLKVSFYT